MCKIDISNNLKVGVVDESIIKKGLWAQHSKCLFHVYSISLIYKLKQNFKHSDKQTNLKLHKPLLGSTH